MGSQAYCMFAGEEPHVLVVLTLFTKVERDLHGRGLDTIFIYYCQSGRLNNVLVRPYFFHYITIKIK